jgi:hypothetical protein
MGKFFGDEAFFQAPHPHTRHRFAPLFHVAVEFIGMVVSIFKLKISSIEF